MALGSHFPNSGSGYTWHLPHRPAGGSGGVALPHILLLLDFCLSPCPLCPFVHSALFLRSASFLSLSFPLCPALFSLPPVILPPPVLGFPGSPGAWVGVEDAVPETALAHPLLLLASVQGPVLWAQSPLTPMQTGGPEAPVELPQPHSEHVTPGASMLTSERPGSVFLHESL